MARQTARRPLIDCDRSPRLPTRSWEVASHTLGGLLDWDPAKAKLFLTRGQRKGGRPVRGTDVQRELSGKHVLNANVLDYLLAHPDLIPEEWKTSEGDPAIAPTLNICFWGTVYRQRGEHCVRFLDFDGQSWYDDWEWIGSPRWDEAKPAALWSGSPKK